MKDKNQTYKKVNRNVITFDGGDDCEALILAKLGMSNKCIQAHTDLSKNQINYRLAKAKQAEDNELGYRVAFRNGVSPLATRMIRDLHAVVQADIRRNVVPKIVHPTPDVVKIKD